MNGTAKTQHRFKKIGDREYEYRGCHLRNYPFGSLSRRWEVSAGYSFHACFPNREKAKEAIDKLIDGMTAE